MTAIDANGGEGYYALAVAILYQDEVTADDAFVLLDGGKPRKTSRSKIEPRLVQKFVELKYLNKTYREIGEMFNLAPDTVCRYVKQAEREAC